MFYELLGRRSVGSPNYADLYTQLTNWWPFDGNLTDVLGGQNLTGTATYVSTTTGQRADNSTALTTAGKLAALRTNQWTIGGRFTPTAVTSGSQVFFTHRALGSSAYERVYLGHGSNGSVGGGINNGVAGAARVDTPAGVVVSNQTISMVLRSDGVKLDLFVDGTFRGFVASSVAPLGGDFLELGYAFAANYSVDHDELFIAEAPLTDANIAALHNGGAGLSYGGLLSAMAAGPFAVAGHFPPAVVGEAYDHTILITGTYTGPIALVDLAAGGVPPGLTLALDGTGTKARLYGTPTAGIAITGSLPSAVIGVPYSERLQVIRGSGAVAVSIIAGAMPPWMTLTWHSGTQEIEFSGTPV